MSKPPRNVFDYFKNAVLYGILTLIFPIGFNFLLLAFSTMLYTSDPKDLVFPISNHNFLTAHVYIIGLFIWLLLVLIGKFFKPFFILPYRTHFHVITFLIWFVIEFDLAAIGLASPFLTILEIFYSCLSSLALIYWMFRIELKGLKNQCMEKLRHLPYSIKLLKALLFMEQVYWAWL